ncbi:hypothetical protein GALMADRAFT_1084167 [Galerina marginata CBS 339.88]|uniref:Uncharacterized protein n=1 Tax=Galerina marginata (strain CBS 339.88) TaxID=685588 RepID=A0A067SBM8_GALM3|nr:hypothetical protein GALMADRAFT_1084167 [Galerina marginata CBS 339.88]
MSWLMLILQQSKEKVLICKLYSGEGWLRGTGWRCSYGQVRITGRELAARMRQDALLCWDYLEGGSKSIADCLDFDENFELGKI